MKMRHALIFLPCLIAPLVGNADSKKLDRPFLESALIFPLEHLHNHGSCIVECPNGDLLVCWYNGWCSEHARKRAAAAGASLL